MKALKLIVAASAIALGATSLQASASTYSSIDSQPGGNRAQITQSIDSQPGGNHAQTPSIDSRPGGNYVNVDYAAPASALGSDERGLDTKPGSR
ncbi:hypothetical protein [Halotalea alkalilenta]|uniref:hypothetical protein n=1 Tax=Halotalea alkalilenta TaxID=376489 RepID=UPI000489A851|nr:hypothetical protein [Halotalea alkalilenta]